MSETTETKKKNGNAKSGLGTRVPLNKKKKTSEEVASATLSQSELVSASSNAAATAAAIEQPAVKPTRTKAAAKAAAKPAAKPVPSAKVEEPKQAQKQEQKQQAQPAAESTDKNASPYRPLTMYDMFYWWRWW